MARAGSNPRKRSSSPAGAAAPTAIPAPGGVMTQRQILLVIYGLMAGMFLSALDQTIVNTSIRTIADDLDGLSEQAWVTTAYLIVSTISTPIYGKLSDIFGRRPLFIIAISIFLVGSLASGFATSMYGLAGFRAIQGLGAGGLMALPLAIMGDMLAPRERAKYQGYFLSVFGISSVIGPLVGGLLAGTPFILGITGWRWVFLINLPIGIIALLMVLRFLHLPARSAHRSVRIDWWGATTVIVGLVPLLLIAEQGREWGWNSPISMACYAVGAVGIVAFVLVERHMGADALIPLSLFRSPTFSMATVLGVLVGFGMFGALSTIPLYLQLVLGSTPTESGYQILPLILGLMISSIASGQLISRTGRYRIFPIMGTGLMSAGFFVFTFIEADTPLWFLMIGMLLVGLGLGQLLQTLTIASQNSVGPRDIGVATSSSTFFRQIGGTLGVAVIFSVLFTRLPSALTAAFDDSSIQAGIAAATDPTTEAGQRILADPANAQILGILQDPSTIGTALDGDTSFLNTSDPALAAPFLAGFADAAVTCFWVALGVVLLAFVLSFFLKATPLRQKSALQEVADADAALLAQHAADSTGVVSGPGLASDTRPIAVVPDASAGGSPTAPRG
ncbi:MDR family MFS transporter [Marisediminicola senii]|uniref:MDR family MFS transporter n=1 Tax=Marisediminicola senii TaxID=2711233 RepID=UPI0013ECFC77|nr:MDR family MFS transporter [Marisediminicola senii]